MLETSRGALIRIESRHARDTRPIVGRGVIQGFTLNTSAEQWVDEFAVRNESGGVAISKYAIGESGGTLRALAIDVL